MAKGPQYRVPYRRRREKKTDYVLRRVLATAEHPRYVVRITNKNIIVQLVESEVEGDYVLTSAHSRELFDKYNWKASGNNLPASYLIGFISGFKAQELGIDRAYLDMGLQRATKGSRIFAVVKGANDAGLDVPINMDVVPEPERINGEFIEDYANSIEDPYRYEKLFSAYLRRGLLPEQMKNHFEDIKNQIKENFNE